MADSIDGSFAASGGGRGASDAVSSSRGSACARCVGDVSLTSVVSTSMLAWGVVVPREVDAKR